jgi:DNA-nicking Smr family endonuclease
VSRHLDPEDKLLFRLEIEGVTPLDLERPEHWRHRPAPYPIDQPWDLTKEKKGPTLSEGEVETHEYLFFARPGVQQRVLADLQRGAIPRELELDLHGLTSAYAEQLCDEFFAVCKHRRIRCAQIIHGKGYGSQERQPVLKRKVNYWLRLHPEVLAFCSATPRDGGTGAVYLLLRNPEKGHRQRRR